MIKENIQKDKSSYKKKLENAKLVIPEGEYCYKITKIENQSDTPVIKIKTCPFWKNRSDWPEQQNGYCRFLKCGDNTKKVLSNGAKLQTLHLWDLVKECNINIPE